MANNRGEQVARALEALGDSTRRSIVERLAVKGLPVGELSEQLPVTRSAVSQHLKVLAEAGLVEVTVSGTRRIYRLNPRGVEVLQHYFSKMWSRALAEFKKTVEDEE